MTEIILENLLKSDGIFLEYSDKDPEIAYFSKDAMVELVNEEYIPNGKFILIELKDHSRWSLEYEVTFEYKGQYFCTSYRRPATELQEEEPFEYENEVHCVRVYPTEVTKIEYLTKGQRERLII